MTYDAKQLSAVLTVCGTCGKPWYMTQPQATCIACQRAISQQEPSA